MLHRAKLFQANLHRADLGEANLLEANLHGADLHEASLFRADLHEAYLLGANLSRAGLGEANLHRTYLRGVDLYKAHLFRANLREAHLHYAKLGGADLVGADLRGAELVEADLCGADLREANLDGVRGVEHAYGLETVRFTSAEDTQASGSGNDANYFESCRRPWPERTVDWECLRGMGRLPLFGMSYTALILIPIVFYGLALYNDNVELVRAWAEQVMALPDHSWHRLAPIVLERLHPRPIPTQSRLLLISTVLLAIASTLYTLRCLSRIKEFSRDQWCDQLGRSLLHYWPLAWKERPIRLVCAACYALGGVGALWVLSTKVWNTAVFIWDNTTWTWW